MTHRMQVILGLAKERLGVFLPSSDFLMLNCSSRLRRCWEFGQHTCEACGREYRHGDMTHGEPCSHCGYNGFPDIETGFVDVL